MKVKRFFAADMRQAMKLVRDELGADASIIANRRVAGGVELTAALDYEAPRLTAPTPGLDAELKKTQERIVAARAELEEFLGRKVHLFTQVKVRPNWLEEAARYSEMGLDFSDGNG